MGDLTFRALQDQQRPWVKHNFGDRPAYYPLLGAVEELGELAHAHLKQEQGIRTTEDHEANAKDAVADTIIFLADYCSSRGWDLQEIVEVTWADVRKRDWKADAALAKGREEGGDDNAERRKWIDEASIEDLLAKNRFAKAGDPFFMGELGKYFLEIMAAKRFADPDAYIRASKAIGWGGVSP